MPTIHKNVGQGAVDLNLGLACPRGRRRSGVGMPSTYRSRPSSIRVAIYRVWEHSGEMGLTRATTRVLQAIIASGVSVSDPFSPVFAKKATLAKLAGCSEVTVYRALKELERNGWISRVQQERLNDGMMDIGIVSITHKLALRIELIAITEPNSVDLKKLEPFPTGAMAHGVGGSKQSNKGELIAENTGGNHAMAASKVEFKAPVVAKMKGGLKDGSIYKEEHKVYPKASVDYQSTQDLFVSLDGRKVAKELVWLISENRLTFGQLFKLQVLAKQVPGQTLSDYVAYRSERLKQLGTSNDCYRYLKKFIDDKIDAKYLVADRDRKAHRANRNGQRQRINEKCRDWAKAYDGKIFESQRTGAKYMVHAASGTIELIETNNNKKTIYRIDRRFMRAVQSGLLTTYVRSVSTYGEAVPCRKNSRTEEQQIRAEAVLMQMKGMLRKGRANLNWLCAN